MPRREGVAKPKSEGAVPIYAAVREAGFPPYVAVPFVYGHLEFQSKHVAKNGNVYTRRGHYFAERHLERNLTVAQAVQRLQQSLGITRDDVIAGMMDGVHAAATSTELIAAWREIGRLIGVYAPKQIKVDHSHSLDVMMQRFAALPDEELAALAGPPKLLLPSHIEHDADAAE